MDFVVSNQFSYRGDDYPGDTVVHTGRTYVYLDSLGRYNSREELPGDIPGLVRLRNGVIRERLQPEPLMRLACAFPRRSLVEWATLLGVPHSVVLKVANVAKNTYSLRVDESSAGFSLVGAAVYAGCVPTKQHPVLWIVFAPVVAMLEQYSRPPHVEVPVSTWVAPTSPSPSPKKLDASILRNWVRAHPGRYTTAGIAATFDVPLAIVDMLVDSPRSPVVESEDSTLVLKPTKHKKTRGV